MHRSGTSLLAEILSKYIFIGSNLDVNNESIYFQRINRWLLSCNSCSWDNPISFKSINEHELNILIKKLNTNLNKKISPIMFFGIKNTIYNKNFNNLGLWGWKDPVNVFTLDLWSRIFKDFKVINVIRNPLDVSLSLLNRQIVLSKLDKKKSTQNNFLSSIIPLLSINKGGMYSSFKINNINDCLKLYAKYYNQIIANNSLYDHVLNVRYENLLMNQEKQLKIIYEFCNINSSSISNDIKAINTSMINKYNYSDIDYDSKLLNGLPEQIN